MTKVLGVSEYEENIIKDILKSYPYTFYYYGSRVKGDYTKSSDLDILIKSDAEIPTSTMEKISLEFNESNIPYIVNLSDYQKLDKNFYNLIEPTLVEILVNSR